jgi:hypothetical protein
MQFRITTSDGQQHEPEADDLQAAIESVQAVGYALDRITSAWYFNTIYDQWMSGDGLLKAYKAAKIKDLGDS